MSPRELILTLAGFGAVIIIVLEACARVRDAIVDQGWLKADSFLGKMTAQKRKSAIVPVLSEIGFTGDHFLALRNTLTISKIYSPTATTLEWRLLEAIRPWIRKPAAGYSRLGYQSEYYIDTMGALYHASADRPQLAETLLEWLAILDRNHVMVMPDCILANKDGNPRLIEETCRLVSPAKIISPIVCKGEKDGSRIAGQQSRLDFEGLESFLESNKDRVAQAKSDSTWKFKIVVADDNCTSGVSICSAAQRFNRLVAAENLPFVPITEAVTLFTRLSPDTEDSFKAAALRLHAIMSLGDSDIAEVVNKSPQALLKGAAQYKNGFGCEFSRRNDLKLNGARIV